MEAAGIERAQDSLRVRQETSRLGRSHAELGSRLVFTVEQRDALREHVLQLAEEDERVVAGAAVGSLAVDGGERYAVHLADLERGPTTYRVFLLPDALQFDLSMTLAAQFRPAGPRFRLLFGDTATDESEVLTPPVAGELFIPTPAVAGDLFGWGVIYALHARACIERGRVWQAEHYVGAVRDHAL